MSSILSRSTLPTSSTYSSDLTFPNTNSNTNSTCISNTPRPTPKLPSDTKSSQLPASPGIIWMKSPKGSKTSFMKTETNPSFTISLRKSEFGSLSTLLKEKPTWRKSKSSKKSKKSSKDPNSLHSPQSPSKVLWPGKKSSIWSIRPNQLMQRSKSKSNSPESNGSWARNKTKSNNHKKKIPMTKSLSMMKKRDLKTMMSLKTNSSWWTKKKQLKSMTNDLTSIKEW